MKLCTTTILTGLDGEPHYAVVAVGQLGWPLALCGKTTGALAKQSKEEAELFASAPAMLDMLERLVHEFGNFNPAMPLGAGKAAELETLVSRASAVVARHR